MTSAARGLLLVVAAVGACGGGDGAGGAGSGNGGGGCCIGGSDTRAPNIVGRSESDAVATLSAVGLTAGVVNRSGRLAGGTGVVVSQSPSAETPLASGATVSFTVSTDPSVTSPPLRLYTGYVPRCGGYSESTASAGGQLPVVGSESAAVGAWIETTYDVASATAVAAGREVTLQLGQRYQCPMSIGGQLDLAGVSPGVLRVNVRVVDTRGNFAEASYAVVVDRRPELTIVEPRDGAVAIGALPLDVRCTDDHPGCMIEVTFGGADIAGLTGVDSIARTVDVASQVGKCATMTVYVTDSVGQQVWQATSPNLPICIESAARMSVAHEVPGEILDVDATRILFYEATSAGEVLSIFVRATGLIERLPLPNGWRRFERSPARLTPSGAIVVLRPLTGPEPTDRVFVARLGAFTDVGRITSFDGLMVSGRYGVWNDALNLYRVDADTGLSMLISGAAKDGPSITADGTVVFTDATGQLVQARGGVQTPLTNDAARTHVGPIAEGDDVVFSMSSHSIAFIDDAAAPIALTADVLPSNGWLPRGSAYQLSGGWVAYTNLSASNRLQIFTRSPQGAVAQRTDLASGHSIDALGGNGELVTLSASGEFGTLRRYFSRPGGFAVEIGSGRGKAYPIHGAWYVAIHGTLLSLDTAGL